MSKDSDSPVSSAHPAGTLERLIGKPPRAWKVEDLAYVAKERGVRIVSLMHVGGDGWLKTLDFVPRSIQHLRDVLEAGERADGSNLFPGTGLGPEDSDIVLRPRLHRAFLDPFSPMPTLAVLCGHESRDQKPLPVSPDTILRAAAKRLEAELGIELWALGEVEYFLGRRSAEGDDFGQAERGYHATSPFVFGEGLRRRALSTLAAIGVHIKYGHSEVGYVEAGAEDEMIWEQHEVELSLAPLPLAADGIVLTQWVLRNLAHQSSMRISFDPIVRVGHAGSGLHFHLSPVVDGEHVGGQTEDGELSEASKWLIAGLVRHAGALMAFGNRTDGSFIRLRQAKEAPSAVTWGARDRNALVRIPVLARTAEGRTVQPATIEFRLPDGSAHPHLLLAGVAQATVHAGKAADLDDLLARTRASRAQEIASVPKSFADVMEALVRNRPVLEEGGVFPAGLLDRTLST
ncbi:MAG: type I glutamate--ammonia ligase [Planctomycetota bacterium]|jgi:glutamine synthetase